MSAHHQFLVLEQAEVEVVAVVKADFWMMYSFLVGVVVVVAAQVCFLVDQWGLTLVMEQVFALEVGLGWFSGGGTGVIHGGFPLGVVVPGLPKGISSGFGVLALCPVLG